MAALKHGDFSIGLEFRCSGRRWRCTDVGHRTITAICLDTHADDPTWFHGPPYGVPEVVFDESGLPDCEPLQAALVTLDWHGFRLRKSLTEAPPQKLTHRIDVSILNPPLGWGDGEERLSGITVTFKRLNDGSSRYVCGGCPLCKPWEFRF